MTSISVRIATLSCLILLANPSLAEIYRWVDENGNVRFSDTVPPKASKLERHVLDKRGNLRDVLKRQRTVEELEQHRKRLDALANEKERRAEQEKYDLYLWTTFASLGELEALRDERLAEHDTQLTNLQSEIDDLERAIARERARKANNVLAQQNLMRSLQEDVRILQEKRAEMELRRKMEFQGLSLDMNRYEYLRVRRAMNQGG